MQSAALPTQPADESAQQYSQVPVTAKPGWAPPAYCTAYPTVFQPIPSNDMIALSSIGCFAPKYVSHTKATYWPAGNPGNCSRYCVVCRVRSTSGSIGFRMESSRFSHAGCGKCCCRKGAVAFQLSPYFSASTSASQSNAAFRAASTCGACAWLMASCFFCCLSCFCAWSKGAP